MIQESSFAEAAGVGGKQVRTWKNYAEGGCYELSVILPPVCTEACEREKSLPQNRVMEAMFDRKTRLEFQPRRRQLS